MKSTAQPRLWTRRRLLASAAGAAVGLTGLGRWAWAALDAPPAGPGMGVVAIASCPDAMMGLRINRRLLRETLWQSLASLTGLADVSESWAKFVQPGQKILLNFASLSGADTEANLPLLEVMLESLEQSGHRRADLSVAGCRSASLIEGLPAIETGWSDKQVALAGVDQPLRKFLDNIDAIVNIPCVCDDNRLGVRGAMANVCLPMIRRPGEYDDKTLPPAIVDACAHESLGGKVRLTLANALQCVYDGGPYVQLGRMVPEGALWASTDMVAIDSLACEWIDNARRMNGLKALEAVGRPAKCITLAGEKGLGQADPRWIHRRIRNL